MKEILKNLKSGIVVGIGFLFTILVGGTIYAVVNNIWANPSDLEATAGNVLSSENWNKILSNQNALSGALNSINSSLTNLNTNLTNLTTKVNTLSGVVSSIQTSLPPSTSLSGIISWKGKLRKKLTNMNYYGSAISGCGDLGYGWRLPSFSELRSLWKEMSLNSSFKSSMNLGTGYYWGDTGLVALQRDSDWNEYTTYLSFSMNAGGVDISTSGNNWGVVNAVCIYD